MSSDDLFAAIFVPDVLRRAVSGRAWLQAMLEAERALARAEARAGVLSREEADGIAAACDASRYDIARIAVEARAAGNPAEPLARMLREASGVKRAHWGATSQDVLDTAAMLVARDARVLIVADLERLARTCARLAEEHRGTVLAARTLLQQAVPTTFGLKAAGWLVGVLSARRRLLALELPAQLGGAAGTLSLLDKRGPEVVGLYAEELGLAAPVLPWHALRAPVMELGAALDLAAGAAAKIAGDVVLLAQTEVGEVTVAAGGVSSTMPHKRNPTGAVLAQACARRVHAVVSALTLEHEHERAVGAWHAEWQTLSDALAFAGGAAAWAHETIEGLEVNVERMRENIRDDTLAESQRLPEAAAAPEDYLGAAEAFVDRALALYADELP